MKKAVAAAILLLAACGEQPQQVKKEPPKPAEPVGAQKAFFQMYSAVRGKAMSDLNGFMMQSITTPGMPQKDGKFAGWRGMFVAPAKQTAWTYTFSAVTEDGLTKGITNGQPESYTGPRGQNSDWPIQALKIDSDVAYKTAMEKGKGADYSKKHPEIPVTMVVEKIKKFGNPVYRVIWGASASNSSFSVYVDASTGGYLETMH
jgi:hypothetical protein